MSRSAPEPASGIGRCSGPAPAWGPTASWPRRLYRRGSSARRQGEGPERGPHLPRRDGRQRRLRRPGAILTNDRYPRAVTATASWHVATTGPSARSNSATAARSEPERSSRRVTVGRFATVGAGAIVTRNVRTTLSWRAIGRRLGWVCACGSDCPDRPALSRPNPPLTLRSPASDAARVRLQPGCRLAYGAARTEHRSLSMIPPRAPISALRRSPPFPKY